MKSNCTNQHSNCSESLNEAFFHNLIHPIGIKTINNAKNFSLGSSKAIISPTSS